MKRRPFSRATSVSGFTLIELLLAVAIAVVVAALAWSLLSSTTRAVGRQADQAVGPERAVVALEALRADLAGLFVPTNNDACRVELNVEAGTPFRFSFCTLRAASRAPDLLWTTPFRVDYAVTAAGDSTAALVRVSQALSGSLAVETNVLLERVALVQVELGDGEAWTSSWSSASSDGRAFPGAARVSLRAREEDELLSADYWLPAGHVATSSLIRAASSP
ncbi:MAG: prepilin-type N-terminal cleavage/methylation domain-containing protein [Kiritimatiellae bacterium]|nr:prepilin-type N-terminal cleavage/methylation domain-containing protein [Kiritimatiellia bacterium]MCO5069365.1 prepilin-type N-terminal cleavage/methylation domain-containing protein [Kiritimatiellia bacterium]